MMMMVRFQTDRQSSLQFLKPIINHLPLQLVKEELFQAAASCQPNHHLIHKCQQYFTSSSSKGRETRLESRPTQTAEEENLDLT